MCEAQHAKDKCDVMCSNMSHEDIDRPEVDQSHDCLVSLVIKVKANVT